jgi:enolase
VSIEDPLAEDDFEGWAAASRELLKHQKITSGRVGTESSNSAARKSCTKLISECARIARMVFADEAQVRK